MQSLRNFFQPLAARANRNSVRRFSGARSHVCVAPSPAQSGILRGGDHRRRPARRRRLSPRNLRPEHTPESRNSVWLLLAAAVIFRVTLWPLVPTLSSDLYRYRWDGKAQLHGLNPYFAQPDDPSLAPLWNTSDPFESRMPATDMPTIYPPLAEQVFKYAARYLPATVAFKLPMELCDIGVMILLAVWLRAEGGGAWQLAIYAWNPLVIVEFAGSGHSDALALAALVGAFLLLKSRRTLSTLLLAAATLLKSFPIMLFPLWLRRNGWPRSARAWLEGAAAAAFALICAWPYRAALHQIPINMATFERNWQDNNASLYTLLKFFSGDSHEFAGRDRRRCHSGIGALDRDTQNRADARRLFDHRLNPDFFPKRLPVVFHLDNSIPLLQFQSSLAAADNPAIPLVQGPNRIPRLRHLQFRPALSSANLHPVLRSSIVASSAEEARKVAPASLPASYEQEFAKGNNHARITLLNPCYSVLTRRP